VIDARTVALLRDIIRHESRSLLQYVAEAYPWTNSQGSDGMAKLREMIDEERDGAAALSDFLRRHRELPGYLGSYPTSFTRLNFVSLDRLLPLLVQEQRKGVAVLEKIQHEVHDTEVRAEVQKVLDRKRRHLVKLEPLAAAETTPGTRR
jgi:hypothetical protein